jgi:hypothetical protein
MGLHQGDKVYDLFSLLFCAGLTAFYVDHTGSDAARANRRMRKRAGLKTDSGSAFAT